MTRSDWLEAVAKHFGICAVQYAALGDVFDDPDSWFISTAREGTRVVRVPSPDPARTTIYLSRAAAGIALPRHRHEGREAVLVLQGGFAELAGRQVRAGEVLVSDPGTEHEIRIDDDQDCICAIRIDAVEPALDPTAAEPVELGDAPHPVAAPRPNR